jgi:hypothetical protein
MEFTISGNSDVSDILVTRGVATSNFDEELPLWLSSRLNYGEQVTATLVSPEKSSMPRKSCGFCKDGLAAPESEGGRLVWPDGPIPWCNCSQERQRAFLQWSVGLLGGPQTITSPYLRRYRTGVRGHQQNCSCHRWMPSHSYKCHHVP